MSIASLHIEIPLYVSESKLVLFLQGKELLQPKGMAGLSWDILETNHFQAIRE